MSVTTETPAETEIEQTQPMPPLTEPPSGPPGGDAAAAPAEAVARPGLADLAASPLRLAGAALGLGAVLALGLTVVCFQGGVALGGVGGVLLALLCSAALYFVVQQDRQNAAQGVRLAASEQFGRDVAEESNANRKLALDMQTSEERFRTLSAASPLGIFEMDSNGNCLYANERWEVITGQGRDESLGKGWTKVLYGSDREPTLAAWEEAARGSQGFERDVRLITQQGAVKWAQISANPLPIRTGDTGRRFVGTIADITERKRAEDGLRTSEMRFRSVVESAIDGILLIDGRGTLLSWNQGAQVIFGYSEEEAVGRSITFLLPGDFRESYWQGVAQVQVREGIDGRKTVCRTVEVMGLRKDGVEFPLEIALSAYRSGDEVFYSAVLRDISERMRTEQMRREKEIAEKANRTKSQFLANMSHELRTPLNAIIGFSEILQDRTFGDLNNKQGRYVENILNSGRHLLQLINDILDLSKIEAGKMELEPSAFSVSTAINDVYNIVKGVAMKKEVQVVQKMPAGLPQVIADQSKFKQVLYNLLSNAIKFTPEGKTVTVGAKVHADTRTLEVSVVDEGIGIAKDDQERIFGEFEQVDNSFSRKEQGTGLGLALTRRFVEMHGGTIGVQSEGNGKGSTFTFTIPLDVVAAGLAAAGAAAAPQAAPQAPAPTAAEEPGGTNPAFTTAPAAAFALSSGKPILMVVEDDDASRELLTYHLGEAGYHVVPVGDPREALATAVATRPSVITLDLMMPQQDGWSVLGELKAEPATRDIPVIILSMTPDRELAFASGAVECFSKPVQKDQLLAAIQAVQTPENPSPTVLVVDDDPTTVEMLTDTLAARGFTVLPAIGGAAGIERATSELPDIIVLDLMMPNVSGFDVVRRLQEHPEAKDIPILIFSANEVTDEARAELDKHVKAILPKRGKAALLTELERLTGHAPAAGEAPGPNGNGHNGHDPVAAELSEEVTVVRRLTRPAANGVAG